MGRRAVEVGKEWVWVEVEGMMREGWGVGEAIRVVFSFLEEFYEPTSSMRLHAYGLGKEQYFGISIL